MRDFRYALRSLARSKGFAAVAITSLALALGLNTTVYAVLDAFINPYLPYRAPERLVRYGIASSSLGDRRISRNDRYLFLRQRVRFTDTTAIYTLTHQFVTAWGSGEDVGIANVSRNFFAVLDIVPAKGRIFQRDGDENTVLVSDALWRRLLAQRAVDSTPPLVIAGQPYVVIGVMPREMALPEGVEIWRPMPPSALAIGIPDQSPQIVSRLNEGVTPDRARAELTLLTRELQEGFARDSFVDRYTGRRYAYTFDSHLTTLEQDPYRLSASHWSLAACTVIVLLIACANLANLLLARGIARRGELALRLAIGASRSALVRQLTTEAGILAAAGGALGVTWAVWGVSLAIGNLPTLQTFITLRPIHLGWHILVFAFVATGLVTILIGLLPAIRASDVSLSDPLKESAGTTTGRARRRYSMLAVTQVALALTLLMSSAILIRSSSQLATEDNDLNLSGAASVFVPPPPEGRLGGPLLADVLERVRAVPGVELAGTSRGIALFRLSGPPAQQRLGGPVVADWDGAVNSPISLPAYSEVSRDYLRVYRRRLLAGRHFDSTDVEVVIVNRTAANALWPRGNAVGHSLRIDNGPWLRVVGVVEDFRYAQGSRRAHQPELYYLPASHQARSGGIVFRSDPADPTVAVAVAREVQATALLPTLPQIWDYGAAARLEATIKGFIARLFVFLAVCGLGLASLGLYGVLAYAVGRRMCEFGVRIALGATGEDVFRLVMHDGAVMVLGGTAIGAFAAMFMAQFVNALLYKVGFTDVVSLMVSELILCGVAFLACLAPARRAMRTDPVEILRAT